MDRLISEKAVIDAINNLFIDREITFRGHDYLISDVKAIPSEEPCEDAIIREAERTNLLIEDCIRRMPPVTPQRPTGEWFLLDDCANEGVYCSVCHKKVYKRDYANQKLKSKFCPNCGARMVEPQERSDKEW